MSMSYAGNVKGYSKSIVLGGGSVLFPIDEDNIPSMTNQIKAFVIEAEKAAYARGVRDAQDNFKRAIGLSVPAATPDEFNPVMPELQHRLEQRRDYRSERFENLFEHTGSFGSLKDHQ